MSADDSAVVEPPEASADALGWLQGSADPDFGALISAHATRLLRLGQYWGWADWIAYGYAKKTRIFVHFGESYFDIFETFTPAHVHEESRTWLRRLDVIGVRYSMSGSSVAEDQHTVNHFLYGQPATTSLSPASSMQSCIDAAPTHANLAFGTAYLIGHYASLGFAVVFTPTNGDCAAGVVAHAEGRKSCPQTFKAIRREVFNSHLQLRDTSWYADCFKACQEVPEAVPLHESIHADSAESVQDSDDEPPSLLDTEGEDQVGPWLGLLDTDDEGEDQVGPWAGAAVVPPCFAADPLDPVDKVAPIGCSAPAKVFDAAVVTIGMMSRPAWVALREIAAERGATRPDDPPCDSSSSKPPNLKPIPKKHPTERGERFRVGQALLAFEAGIWVWRTPLV